MTKINKLILKVLTGRSDANISFAELRKLLIHLGFEERVPRQSSRVCEAGG
jgi:hypothetical protein